MEDIDTNEFLQSPLRLAKITDYIIANHNRKTHDRQFNAIFCVSSIDVLIKYYKLFKERRDEGRHKLKIAAIYTYGANEEDKDANGNDAPHYSVDTGQVLMVAESPLTYGQNPEPMVNDADNDAPERDADVPDNIIQLHENLHSRDQLEKIIDDYNAMFSCNYTTKDSQSFYNYNKDIGKRVEAGQIDILLVVNMFLTGFDAPCLNTLYVDKSLKYHGLVQAYSRTNRLYTEKKSHGNILCFRNLKRATDDAIALFANREAREDIVLPPYETVVGEFAGAFAALLAVAPTADSVSHLEDEEKELQFVQAFRNLLRLKNQLSSFVDFSWDHLLMKEQDFEDYKSKYLDLHEKVKAGRSKEKVSILEDVDFQLELVHRVEVNVTYILRLLADLRDTPAAHRETRKQEILKELSNEIQLRSKRELIQKFIQENLLLLSDSDDISDSFNHFWTVEKARAFDRLCREEKLSPEKFRLLLDRYLLKSRLPLSDDILDMYLGKKPRLLERKALYERILSRFVGFVETFINGIAV